VHSGAYLEAKGLYRAHDRLGGTQRPRRSVEGSQETVVGGVDLAAAEPGQFVADQPGVQPR
jgi:hypothetical protein